MIMEKIIRSILGFFLIAAFANPAKALSCYVCNSMTNGGCSDPFDTAKVEDDCTQCVKFVANNVVTRMCEPVTIANNGCASETQDGHYPTGKMCLCDTDRCNAASVPVAYIPILLVACALAAKTTFMY